MFAVLARREQDRKISNKTVELSNNREISRPQFQPVIAPTQPSVMTARDGTDHGRVSNTLVDVGVTPDMAP